MQVRADDIFPKGFRLDVSTSTAAEVDAIRHFNYNTTLVLKSANPSRKH